MNPRARLGLASLRWCYRLECALPALIDEESLHAFNRTAFDEQAAEWIGRAEDGFLSEERRLFDRLNLKAGRALCLASGGGREAFALAREGFSVVGVEQVEEMVEASRAFAEKASLPARFVLGDMTAPALGSERFDLVFIANMAYSGVPTRRARAAWLARLRPLLADEGLCVASFSVRPTGAVETRWFPFLKRIARMAGNPGYELGDRIDANPAFFRHFPDHELVGQEAREAGFTKVEYYSPTPSDHFAILSR